MTFWSIKHCIKKTHKKLSIKRITKKTLPTYLGNQSLKKREGIEGKLSNSKNKAVFLTKESSATEFAKSFEDLRFQSSFHSKIRNISLIYINMCLVLQPFRSFVERTPLIAIFESMDHITLFQPWCASSPVAHFRAITSATKTNSHTTNFEANIRMFPLPPLTVKAIATLHPLKAAFVLTLS